MFCYALVAIAFSTNTNILAFGFCFLVTISESALPLYIIFTFYTAVSILVESQAFSPPSDKLCLSDLRNLANARQVFCPLNLTFNPHKRQLPSFPVFPGFMHGSILPVTNPPGHTPGDLQFCSHLAVYSPPPGTQKETILHPRDCSSTTNTLFCVQNIDYDIDFRTIAKPDILTRT